MTDTLRSRITDDFARWTALSALRSGVGHPKSRDAVYGALGAVRFPVLFDLDRSSIEEAEFARWHRAMVLKLDSDGFCVGWAAKIINVYLKTRVYLGGDGRKGLVNLIHPPIDSGLWRGIREKYPRGTQVDELVHPGEQGKRVSTINGITTYKRYRTIIEGCRRIADEKHWMLIEVESLWLQG